MQGRIQLASRKHPQDTQLCLSSNLTCCGNC